MKIKSNFMKMLLIAKSNARTLINNRSNNFKISYSQCGEDLIIRQLFNDLGISSIAYVDIGAHHPTYLSNTYLFYADGSSGVCVEPDPVLFRFFIEDRPRDINLNCGVGPISGEADFYVMNTATLNTFSAEEANRYASSGKNYIRYVRKIMIKHINEIFSDNFRISPNLVSIDIEGWDLMVLKSFDFKKYRPEVFCIETLSYTDDKSEKKLTEIIELMHANDYLTYADTYINTIFVDRASWENRPS